MAGRLIGRHRGERLAGWAVLLAGEAAVRIQQHAALLYGARWVGPLFLANAVACVAMIAAWFTKSRACWRRLPVEFS